MTAARRWPAWRSPPLGPDALFGVTDQSGRFVFSAVPVGTYLIRAQRAGYRASGREFVDVTPAASARHIVRLARLGGTCAGHRRRARPRPPSR